MKRLLIISYHFPPLNVIASHRAEAFARYLPEFGWDTTVLSLDWMNEGEEKWNVRKGGAPDESHEGNTKVIRLGIAARDDRKGGPIKTLSYWRKGIFEVDEPVFSSRTAMISFLEDHLNKTSYDAVLCIFSPHYHLEIGHWINKRFKLPVIFDFRDLWSVDANINGSAGLRQGTKDWFVRRSWKKWSKSALFFSTVSEPYLQFLESELGIPGLTVMNGFEPSSFEGINSEKYEVYTVSHVGTFYASQNIAPVFRAIAHLRGKFPHEKFRLLFHGIKNQEMESRIHEKAQVFGISDYVEIKPRTPRKDALEVLKRSHALFYPAWPDNPGIYSGKLFEYIGSGTPVVVCPDDSGVVHDLVQKTESGVCFQAEYTHDMGDHILQCFLKNVSPTQESKTSEITRRSQVEIFANKLNEVIG